MKNVVIVCIFEPVTKLKSIPTRNGSIKISELGKCNGGPGCKTLICSKSAMAGISDASIHAAKESADAPGRP